MRKKQLLIIAVCFLLGNLFGQDYINVGITTGNKQDLIDNIEKITFSGDNIVFELNSGGGTTEPLDNITQITFGTTDNGDQSLPIELNNFVAIQNDDDVNLQWETATEVNNKGFDIERKHSTSDGWKKVAFVQGKGNSSSPVSYSYKDKNVYQFSNIKYRLKQIDTDGSYEYSAEISVELDEIQIPTQFVLHNNYPNPFNPTTYISYDIANEGQVTMKIYDMSGREVETLINQNQQPGKYIIEFDGGSLSSGVYFCRLTSGNNVKIIKMLLVK